MPQAPLPAPASRIGQVPPLITPIVQPFMPPPNVLPYVHNPDMLSAAQKGIELGAMIGRLPRTAHENAAQSAMAAITQEQSKMLQDNMKYIQTNKDLTPDQKTAKMRQLLMESGFGYGQGGGTFDPGAAAMRVLQYQQGVQSYQQQQQAFPLEQQGRQQNLQGGPAAAAAGSTNVDPNQAQQTKQEHILNPNAPKPAPSPVPSATPTPAPVKTTMVQGGDNTQLTQANFPQTAPVAQTLQSYLDQYPAPATFLS